METTTGQSREASLYADDPTIVTCVIARAAPRISLSALFGLVVVFLAIFALPLLPGFEDLHIRFVAVFLIVVFLLIFAMAYRSFRRRFAPLANVAPDARTPLERVLKAQDENSPFLSTAVTNVWSWASLANRMKAEGIERPRTIVARALSDRLAPIERPAHFMEPEPILPSSHFGPGMTIAIIGLYVFNALLQFFMGQYVGVALWLVAGGFFAALIPPIRDALRQFWDSGGNIVAGQGWVRDKRGRVWTTADAMLMILSLSGSSAIGTVLTGPAGVTMLSFMSERDPDFIKLWQRWNHPDPRPELAGQDE